MGSPSGSATAKDANNIPAPQFWDPLTAGGQYNYVYGSGVTNELFTSPAPAICDNSGAYASSRVVKSGAGTFFGFDGQYNGALNVWIMAFDATAVPSTGFIPIASAACSPASGGTDVNFGSSPSKPRKFVNGLVIATSSTGGTFTFLSFGAGLGITLHTDFI